MATAFSLVNQLKVTAAWVEPLGITNASVADQTRLTEALTLTNGSNSFEATGYWKDQIACGSGVTTIDVSALPHKAFGGAGLLGFSSIKMLLVFNRSESHGIEVFAVTQGGLTSVAAGGVILPPSGVMYLTGPRDGWLVSAESKLIALNNTAAEGVLVDFYIAGVVAQ